MNNSTSNSIHSCPIQGLDGAGYGAVFLLGLLINAAALRAFLANRASWTDTHVYMLNLVLADSALVLFLPFRVYDAFKCIPRTSLCTFLIYVHYINMYASIWTTTAISVQRYLAVRFPMLSRSWRRKKETAFVVCLLLWVLLVTLCTLFREENQPDNLWTCYERCKDRPLSIKFMVLLVILGFFTPLLIVVFCSGRIICILSKADVQRKESRNTVSIVTANMVVFVVCYTPIHVAFLVNFFNRNPPLDWRSTPQHKYLLVSEWIASTNCCLDSISYYFLLKGFFSGRTLRCGGSQGDFPPSSEGTAFSNLHCRSG